MHILLVGTSNERVARMRARGLKPVGLRDPALPPPAGDVPTFDQPLALWEAIPPPRALWCGLESDGLERHLADIARWLEPGDVLLDPSPSWWGDTCRRERRSRHRALHHLDLVELSLDGTPHLLVGGREEAVATARPWLERLAPQGGYLRAGAPGAAHFLAALAEAVRTVTALAHDEAIQLAEAFPAPLDAALLRRLWPEVAPGDGREGWIADDAVRLEAALPLLVQAVMLRIGERLDEHRSTPPPPRFGPAPEPEA